MRFLLLVCWDAEKMDAQTEPDPTDTTEKESFPWLDDLQARGISVTGDQVAPPRRARSVRVRDGKTMVTDGPFAETKEVVGGFDILECDEPRGGRRDRRRAPDRPDGNDRGSALLGQLTERFGEGLRAPPRILLRRGTACCDHRGRARPRSRPPRCGHGPVRDPLRRAGRTARRARDRVGGPGQRLHPRPRDDGSRGREGPLPHRDPRDLRANRRAGAVGGGERLDSARAGRGPLGRDRDDRRVGITPRPRRCPLVRCARRLQHAGDHAERSRPRHAPGRGARARRGRVREQQLAAARARPRTGGADRSPQHRPGRARCAPGGRCGRVHDLGRRPARRRAGPEGGARARVRCAASSMSRSTSTSWTRSSRLVSAPRSRAVSPTARRTLRWSSSRRADCSRRSSSSR